MKTMVMPDVPSGVELVKFAASHILAPDYTPEALEAAEDVKKRLVRFKRDLLPLEDAEPVENRLGDTLETVGRMKAQKVIATVQEGRYQILDPAVFDWRDANGMPRLMPFRLQVPQAGFIYQRDEARFFGLSSDGSNGPTVKCAMFPRFPIHIEEHYQDVVRLVMSKGEDRAANEHSKVTPFSSIRRTQFKMLTRFGGYIPQEVKWEMVRAWTSHLFQSLFIVAEVQDWQEDLAVMSFQGDPLVVGYDGYQLWLIAAFDTTSLEEVARAEYCTRVGN